MPLTLTAPPCERFHASASAAPERPRTGLENATFLPEFRGGLPAQEAFARALACPDVFLIDGEPSDRKPLVEAFVAAAPQARVLVVTTDSQFAEQLTKPAAELAALEARARELAARRQQLATEIAASDNHPGVLSRLLHRRQYAERERERSEKERQIQAVQAEETQVQARRETMLKEQANACVRLSTLTLDGRPAGFVREFPDRCCVSAVLSDSSHPASEILTAAGAKPALADGLREAAGFSELESLHAGTERNPIAIAVGNAESARGLLNGVLGSGDAAFDWLIFDGVDQVEESQLLAAVRLAPRQVLLGRSRLAQDSVNGTSCGRLGVLPRLRKGDAVAIDVFTRLVERLDQEPWRMDGDRLIRRILPLSDLDSQSLVRESVLDRPEIELWFASDEDGEPQLAEVAFPAGMPATEAKAFLFATLGEVLLRPVGESHTHDYEDAIVVCWPAVDHTSFATSWLDLEPGVRERVTGEGAHAYTSAIAFDRAHGWTAERAAAWLADHLSAGSPSRVAVLPVMA